MKLKKGFVQFLICFVFFWAILDMITMREDYPFAPYKMYSYIHTTVNHAVQRVVVVRSDGSEMDLVHVKFYPWDEARYNIMIGGKWRGPGGKEAVISAFKQTLELSEKDGGQMRVFKDASIVGLRYYEYRWKRLTVANRETPDERNLLTEYVKKP